MKIKKISYLFICALLFLLTVSTPLDEKAQGFSLKGTVNHEIIPKGFYGTWGVVSKLKSSNNPEVFNEHSKDIWVLSGQGNVLILENKLSGAKSEVIIKNKNKEKDTLKFSREKIVENENKKTVYK